MSEPELEGPSNVPVWWTSHAVVSRVPSEEERKAFVKARLWFEARAMLGGEAYRLDTVCSATLYEAVWSSLEGVPVAPLKK